MERGKQKEANSSSVSSTVLREDIVNLRDFIERLKNEEDQTVLDTDQIEKLKLQLTFLSACLQLCYYISDGFKAEMSCISYEVHDLVQSLFHQSGDGMLVKLKDHVFPRLLENIKRSIISDHHSESSATMTEDQLVELLDAVLVNLNYLPKVHAELILPSMTQYELLQKVFGNLRDFHGLKVNGCIEYETIEYVLPQFQLMAERVGHFCFFLLSYQLDKTDEKDEDELDKTDESDEDGLDETDKKDEEVEFSQVNSMLLDLLLKIIPVSLEVMHICSTNLKASKSAEVGRFIKQLLQASPEILREYLTHLQQRMVNAITPSTSARIESMPSIDGKILVGFEEETEWIIRKLTSGPDEVDVISIVGMPGLGKTTLAYKVYNDKSVVDHFDVRAWCTVDQERNEKKLLKKIFNELICLKGRVSEDAIDDDVADKLRKQLCGKRYLIVLDDLWDTATWDELTRPFPEFQKRSRIILTSRKKEVALHGKCHSDPLDLRMLRPEESWELLEKRVFGEERCPDELRDVGEKIARKCDGLPLVLDLIGGVISRKEKKKDLWLEVLNNLSSFIFKDEEEVAKVIQLSYDHLSDHLKPCFLYLASYPKDEYIEISWLKNLWSCEGLVEPTVLKNVEEVLEVYVAELISSSLVIVRGGWEQTCQIHDLVHDFCSIKARKEKLFDLTSSIVLSSSSSSSDLMLHRRTIVSDDDISSLFNPEKRNPYVKHLLSLQCKYLFRTMGLPNNSHLRHLRLLKRLELPGIILTDTLLNEICMLVHLRCLFILTNAKALPPSFSNLCNLEILRVHNLGSDMELSPSIWSLAKLRHVFIYNCSVSASDIDKTTKLENLTTLKCLKLSCSVDSENTFKRFPNLRTLEFQMGCSAAEQIYFPRLDLLNKLEKVTTDLEYSGGNVHQLDFHFPSSLKEVELSGFDLASDALSRIGRSLPNLQKLKLESASIKGGKEWNMEQVTFQNLKLLTLYEVPFSEWQVIADESFPVLEELEIRYCTKLIEIPESFGDIASLKLISVYFSPQLKESALKIKEYVEEMTGEDKLEVKI